MTLAEILEGAQTWARNRRDITYQMGGQDVKKGGKLDCSAFVWQVLGEVKRDRNTDWIRADAIGRQSKFRQIPEPVPGCIAVYGGRWEQVPGQAGKRHAGHVGIVVDVAKKTVIDCSSSQNGIRMHRQPVLFDGPSDKRTAGLIFCVPKEIQDVPPVA
jgi:hypothetical protein